MKKRIIMLLLVLIMPIMVLTGCTEDTKEIRENRFILVLFDKESGCYQNIYVDKETRVMYLFVRVANGGGVTVMLNADGTPMLWEGEL